MRKSYLLVGLALAIDALIIAVIIAVLSLAYWLLTGASGAYLAMLSNLLFFTGAIVFVFGAIVEFFHMSRMAETYRLLMSPLKYLGAGNEIEEHAEEKDYRLGWLLVVLGALLIALSFAASFEYFL